MITWLKQKAHLNTALNQLAGYSVPLVEWKIYSLLGRVRLHLGDGSAAEAFERASTIVQMIAANVHDEKLRASFLASPAVQEVFMAERPQARINDTPEGLPIQSQSDESTPRPRTERITGVATMMRHPGWTVVGNNPRAHFDISPNRRCGRHGPKTAVCEVALP